MSAPGYSYFDEAYFQDGSKRGTAYVNYRQTARDSQTFREIASALREVFQPRRVLDIGCATGMIVRRLNELGCEAHGIDVSAWAVANAEHPNVRLASADKLPYPDAFFDVVISCHALEHIPENVFAGSIREMNRVCSKYFFHMLPLIGTGPYTGDPEAVKRELRKDPTHQQLQTKAWWIDQFSTHGCAAVDHCILFRNETANAELSTGQFWMRKGTLDDSPVLARATARNQRIFRDVQIERIQQMQSKMPPTALATLIYDNRTWKDIEKRYSVDAPLDLTGTIIHLVTIVEGAPCTLRFAAGRDSDTQPYADVGEFHFTAQPGCNAFTFTVDQLQTLRGSPDYSAVTRVALGGENQHSKVLCYMSDHSGRPILS
jgi:SAM-dependent methyltransferase